MPKRYDNRRILLNREPLYDNYFEERHVKSIRQYNSATMRYPTADELSRITKKKHIWGTGDRYYKVAIENYGSAQYWWVIALFNKKPTEADIKNGEVIWIPLPLENILRLYNKV